MVFTTKPFEEGTFPLEYKGELLSHDEQQSRQYLEKNQHISIWISVEKAALVVSIKRFALWQTEAQSYEYLKEKQYFSELFLNF